VIMRKRFSLIGIISTLCLVVSGSLPVLAVNGKVGLEARSAYVWRGITRTEGVVLDPVVDVKMGGFTFGFWGNVNLEEYNEIDDQGLFTESDITLSYDIDIDTAIIGLGYIEYLYTMGREDTREVFASMRGPVFSDNLFAGIKIFYDFGVMKDFYVTADLNYIFKIVDSLKGDVGASVGYIGEDMSVAGEGGLNDYMIYFGVNYAVDSNLEIGGKVAFVDSLDQDVLPDQPVDFFLGLHVAQKF